jgi:peptidoglycan hydrolase-like protein with peptidoglycan-binding domain/surface antigen
MCSLEGLTAPDRPVALAPGLVKHRSLAIVVAILLVSGCSHPPGNTAVPVEPSSSASMPSTPSTTVRPADPEVRAAQESLAGLGYYRGPIDGIDGPKTRAAVANYQTDEGLSPDGKVSRELVARLAGGSPTSMEHATSGPAIGPVYEPGDVYVYTDGHVETVLSATDRRVEWRDAAGLHWSADPDFTLPAGRPDAGAIVALNEALSWPLRVGATAAYTVKSGPAGERAAGDHWRCAVESRESMSVAAGTFDSYKIACRLDGDPLKTTQSRTWYYAPAVGHYVRYIDDATIPSNDVTRTRSRDLVAVSPGASGWPSEARIGLEWAVSHALEAEPDGQRVPWESSAIAARFVIEPGGRVDAGHSGQCRRFNETRIAADAVKRLYPGIACRSDGGRWRLLGLDGAPFERTASSS